MTEAATFAQDKFEEFRGIRWEAIPEGTAADKKTGSTGVGYSRSWTVETEGNIKTVTLTIVWNDRMDRSITFVLPLSKLA